MTQFMVSLAVALLGHQLISALGTFITVINDGVIGMEGC